MTLAMAAMVATAHMAHTAPLAGTTIMAVQHTRLPPFTVMAPVRIMRGRPMCQPRCCSLTTDQAAVTGDMMDTDGAAASINFMTGEIGVETVRRAARFAVAGLTAGTAGIDRGLALESGPLT